MARQYTIDPQGKQNGGIAQNYVRLKDLEQGAPVVYSAVKDLRKGAYTAPCKATTAFMPFFM